MYKKINKKDLFVSNKHQICIPILVNVSNALYSCQELSWFWNYLKKGNLGASNVEYPPLDLTCMNKWAIVLIRVKCQSRSVYLPFQINNFLLLTKWKSFSKHPLISSTISNWNFNNFNKKIKKWRFFIYFTLDKIISTF